MNIPGSNNAAATNGRGFMKKRMSDSGLSAEKIGNNRWLCTVGTMGSVLIRTVLWLTVPSTGPSTKM